MTDNDQENFILEENTVEHDFATSNKQEARALLRERFLRVITGIVGKQAKFHLHENSNVAAEFRGCDVDCLDIFVRNLETPLGIVPEAILRTTDVISFSVEGVTLDR